MTPAEATALIERVGYAANSRDVPFDLAVEWAQDGPVAWATTDTPRAMLDLLRSFSSSAWTSEARPLIAAVWACMRTPHRVRRPLARRLERWLAGGSDQPIRAWYDAWVGGGAAEPDDRLRRVAFAAVGVVSLDAAIEIATRTWMDAVHDAPSNRTAIKAAYARRISAAVPAPTLDELVAAAQRP